MVLLAFLCKYAMQSKILGEFVEQMPSFSDSYLHEEYLWIDNPYYWYTPNQWLIELSGGFIASNLTLDMTKGTNYLVSLFPSHKSY